RGVARRAVPGVERGAVAGGEIDRVENVLHPDRQAGERPRRDRRILRAPPRRVEVERDESADLFLSRRDPLGALVEPRGGGDFARLDAAGKVERGKHWRIFLNTNAGAM